MGFVLKDGHWIADTEEEVRVASLRGVVAVSFRRVVRSFVQAFIGSLSLSLPAVVATTDLSIIRTTLTSLGLSAALAGATAAVSLLHNMLEDTGTVPSTK